MTDPITPPPNGQTPPSGEPPGQTPTPQGTTPSGPQQKTSIGDLPEDIQDYIKTLRADAKQWREKVEAETKAKQDAEQKRLAEQGQYKELADQHEAKVKELEPVVERYSKLSERIGEQIKAEIKDWPDEVKKLVPNAQVSIEERVEQVEKLRPLVDKLAGASRAALPGNRPNPTPTGAANQLNSDTAKNELIKSGLYKAF